MLVEAGADVNATGCHNGETLVQITPYCAARYYRREAVAEYLWDHGSTLDVFRAAFLGDLPRVEQHLTAEPALLTAEDPHDEIYYCPPVTFAVAGGHADLVAYLIECGAQIAQYSSQLIGLAAKASRRDLLDLLLANGADARAVGAAVFVAAPDLDILTYLLDKGVSPNGVAGDTVHPLAYVARGDKSLRPDKVRLLLDYGADVNGAGPNGKTALDYAMEAGHSSVVDLLLERGAKASDSRIP
jgi:ankyrin repeat protein